MRKVNIFLNKIFFEIFFNWLYKDSLGGVLSKKAQDVREDVKDDITRQEYDLNRNAAQQKSESSKIQMQIKNLQNEKKSLDIQIMGLQRRISEIEETVGIGINDL